MHPLLSGIEFISRGGWMMYPLLLSGLVALTIIFERTFAFHRIYATSPERVESVLDQVRRGQIHQAIEQCRQTQSPVLSILSAGLAHFDHSMEEMELSMKNRADRWVPILEKRIEVIDTVITAAPLLGLLGTITGMMASFQVLSEKGVNEPNAITGGVAEALIATATGLVIALVCLVAYNYLTAQVKRFICDIESTTSSLTELHLTWQRTQKKSS